jgi:hypothetical protein
MHNNVMHTIRQEVLPGMGRIVLMHSIRQVAYSGIECIEVKRCGGEAVRRWSGAAVVRCGGGAVE